MATDSFRFKSLSGPASRGRDGAMMCADALADVNSRSYDVFARGCFGRGGYKRRRAGPRQRRATIVG
ncbi:MAG: hypothetical protein CTY36_07210 [Methylocystis sp.]|nr:MAG: hypothetical protein CTY36_07210 [Methylocystis sp.]